MATATATKKKKWTQAKFAAKLLPALKALGKGQNQVAESLRKKKIKGDPSSTEECVVAIYVARIFKDAKNIIVTDVTIDVDLDGETFRVNTPSAVGKMIANFDEEKYSFLLADGYRSDL